MFISYRKAGVLFIGAAILVLPVIVSMLQDEAEYESWEQNHTDNREVFWMQEPILHKLKKFLSSPDSALKNAK